MKIATWRERLEMPPEYPFEPTPVEKAMLAEIEDLRAAAMRPAQANEHANES